jgi:hypothetical protein
LIEPNTAVNARAISGGVPVSSVSILPVAKTLYLCDGHIGFSNQKTDLMGIFNSIRPARYPYVHKQFVIFAQLISGLGQVPFFLDLRYAATGQTIYTSKAQLLYFAHRQKLVQLAYTVHGCLFPQPGTYLVELFCNGQWVADTTLELL